MSRRPRRRPGRPRSAWRAPKPQPKGSGAGRDRVVVRLEAPQKRSLAAPHALHKLFPPGPIGAQPDALEVILDRRRDARSGELRPGKLGEDPIQMIELHPLRSEATTAATWVHELHLVLSPAWGAPLKQPVASLR